MKIRAKLFGGLGNQLFIYSAMRSLAIRSSCNLEFDITSGFVNDRVYKRQFALTNFNIPNIIIFNKFNYSLFYRIYLKLMFLINGFLPISTKFYILEDSLHLNPKFSKLKIIHSIYVEGYWQSEDYFREHEEIIRNDLQITPPSDDGNTIIAKLISETNSVAVHIRFFLNSDVQNKLDLDFYLINAFKYIDDHVYNPKFFIFSNDIPRSKNLTYLKSRNCFFIDINSGDLNAYADLWLMTLCKNHIISNSTFSWWGAWLANNINGVVVSPGEISDGQQITWGFEGNLPSRWIKI